MSSRPGPGARSPAAYPWYRRATADLLALVWNAWGSLSYLLKGRGERARLYRRFCDENGLELPGSERWLHRYHRRHERCKATVVMGAVLKDLTKLERIYGRFRIVGREILEGCRERGAILVAFHVGPYSMIGPVLTRMGFDVTILARGDEVAAATGRDLAEVNRVLAERLAFHGFGTAQLVDSQAMLSLVQIRKALGRKGLLLVYPDTAKSSSTAWAPLPFFRQQIAGHLGLAKLLQMTRADVVHLVTWWDERGDMVLEVLGPCPYRADASPEELLRALYGPLEGLVARCLPQWTQLHSYDELKFDAPLPAPKSS